MINSFFVTRCAPDICRKIQKIDGFAGMNASQLLQRAQKVFVNWEKEAKKEHKYQQTALLAAIIGKLLQEKLQMNKPHY